MNVGSGFTATTEGFHRPSTECVSSGLAPPGRGRFSLGPPSVGEVLGHHKLAAARSGQALSYSAPPTVFSLIAANIAPGEGRSWGST